MHCEKAPCEPVCPVAASVHDGEGLNVQVYNRCIGTRFCQANCPYQVRRFNFFDYADAQAYADLGADLLKGLKNPDVTVRGARRDGEVHLLRAAHLRGAARGRKDGPADRRRRGRDGLPGRLPGARRSPSATSHDPDSAVAAARQSGRHYALLGELGTRPHTTYLARIEPDEEGDAGA